MARSLYCADHHDDPGFVALFSEDAVLELRGRKLTGTAEIERFLAARPRERVTRHLFSPPAIDMIDAQSAKGVLYFLLHEAQQGQEDAEGHYPMTLPSAVGEYHDRFVLTEAGWRIASRQIVSVFRS
jgi:hypothetical protein